MHAWARSIANWVGGQTGVSVDQTEVLTFGALTVLHNGLTAGLVALGGLVLGVLPQTLGVALIAGLLRRATGGAHCRTPWRCTLTAALIFPLVGLAAHAAFLGSTALPLGWQALAVLALAALGSAWVWRFAPAESPAKPLSAAERPRLQRWSRWMAVGLAAAVLSGTLSPLPGVQAGSVALLTGFLWQSLMLTPVGFSLLHSIDRLLGQALERLR